MAGVDQQQGGPSTSRRRKQPAKQKPQPPSDWTRTREPPARASPRPKPHGDIDIEEVESSDDPDTDSADPPRPSPSVKQLPRRRPPTQPSSPAESDSSSDDTPSDTTAPARAPRRQHRQHRQPSSRGRSKSKSKSMPVPNGSASVADPAAHRRPTYTLEEPDDDDDDGAPSGPSRPTSRQTIARRDISPRSANPYRSTPESRRSPRTSVSDSEDDTDATSDSDEEQVILARPKHLPPAPMAPTVPSAPALPTIHSSLQERLSRRPEMVYEEEEGDATSRYARSVARHRSLSRPPSSGRLGNYRRPRDIVVSGPPSLDETRRSRSRSKSAKPSRRHYESDVYVPSRAASTFKKRHAASAYSPSSSAKRSTFFADFATPSGRPAAHAGHPTERTTICVNCRDNNTPVSKTAKLKCLHRMCHSCLRNRFKLSLTDPQRHMPPQCCDHDISPELVGVLFDSAFGREWNEKFMEYTGRNRLICPSRRCAEPLKPENMRREGPRWQGKCGRCKTKVCGSCSGRWHAEPECPRVDEPRHFLEQAKREPWQRCYRCKTMVEIKDGRNHMICRCGGEFCLLCGGKWKTCDCPWFKDDSFEAATVNSRANPFASHQASPHDRDFQSDFAPPAAITARPRPSSYEEDPYLRRLHDQRDDHLTRRMHSFDAFGQRTHPELEHNRRDYEFDDAHDPRDRRRRLERREYEATFPEEDYRRAATVVAPSPPQGHVLAAPPPPHSAFEPPSRPALDRSVTGFEYSSPAHRSRGARYTSPERYDEYVMEQYTPERRRQHSPDPWQPFTPEHRPRSRDRRYTFPTESRPTSPEGWQPPTRYPSLERPTPSTDERRRAPSPDRRRPPSAERRRASSLERRLAGRFKKESWQSPGAPGMPPVGAIGPVGPIGPMGPLSPTRAPPTPSRANTHVGAGMPMAPVPPPGPHGAPPAMPGLRRHHTMDDEAYGLAAMSGGGMPPPSDWFGPPLPHGHPHAHPHAHPPPPGVGMMMHPGHPGHHPGVHPGVHPGMHDLGIEVDLAAGSPRAPNVKRRAPQGHRGQYGLDVPRSSVLAGLGGMGRGMHRVSEWVNYVEPGAPNDDVMTAVH